MLAKPVKHVLLLRGEFGRPSLETLDKEAAAGGGGVRAHVV